REDLFYRLNVVPIKLPPLREHKEDIPDLVEHFIKKCNMENGFLVEGVDNKGMELLMGYNWPGNIRELENSIERAVVFTRKNTINGNVFNFETSIHSPDSQEVSNGIPDDISISEMEKRLIYRSLEKYAQNKTRAAEVLGISIRTLRNKLNEYEGNKSENNF
ncbi:MAG: helix-turn-helix domain-containing protein, partial [bacterium]